MAALERLGGLRSSCSASLRGLLTQQSRHRACQYFVGTVSWTRHKSALDAFRFCSVLYETDLGTFFTYASLIKSWTVQCKIEICCHPVCQVLQDECWNHTSNVDQFMACKGLVTTELGGPSACHKLCRAMHLCSCHIHPHSMVISIRICLQNSIYWMRSSSLILTSKTRL